MSFFAYRDGEMHAEGVALEAIARQVGTPFYCYSAGALRAAFREFADGMKGLNASLCYALKANSNLAVVKLLGDLGVGADIVSVGEMQRALAAGIPAHRIVYSGVGKKASELVAALQVGVGQINVESAAELETLNAVAGQLGVKADITIRVNPDIDAGTHEKITTGRKENKFGIDLAHAVAAYRHAAQLPGLRTVGLAVNIGSQLTRLRPFETAFTRIAALYRQLRADGVALERLDLGGGLGIRYKDETPPSIADYAAMVKRVTGNLGATLAFEPGRALVANAGVLVARVLHVKRGVTRRFVILDAAMNDLMRPALYDAWHEILPLRGPAARRGAKPVDIVGPVCETGDSFAVQRKLPALEAGDGVALMSAGAYGASMSSAYNTRLPAPEVLVRGAQFTVIRPRSSYEAILAQDRMPSWLAKT